MKSVPRFALLGKSGAGKSEIAKALKEHLGCRIVKTGAICRTISQVLFGNEDKHSTQILDDALTVLDPSIFLKAAARDITFNEAIVIDALRFMSDVAIADHLGCKLVRVVANADERVRRLQLRQQTFELARDGVHRSETELDACPVDHVIMNGGTMSDLQSQVADVVASYRT